MKSARAPKETGPRDAAFHILMRIQKFDAYADRALESGLSRFPLFEADRSLTTELVYGALRWRGRLDWIIRSLYHGKAEAIPNPVRQALRLGLYQLLFLDRVPPHAAVNESVRLVKQTAHTKWSGTVNGMLRSYLRDPGSHHHVLSETDSAETIAGWMSHPVWLVRRWLDRLGFDRTLQICRADNERPPIGLRVNILKTDLRSVRSRLEEEGIPCRISPLVPDWLTVRTFGPTVRRLVDEGRVTVQDGSAALAAHLVGPEPGDIVLDAAAAPGGKTGHLAELSEDRAFILALDRRFSRVSLIRDGLERLGVRHVYPAVADSRHLPAARADKILLDAPCSGMGVIRRRAELRWRMRPGEIPKLTALQRALLHSVATALKPGGILVYSTCTVCPEENQEMIERFLSGHNAFEIESADGRVSGSVVSAQGMIETWPDRHGLDGGFAVRMRKMR